MSKPEHVVIDYTNWKGERRERTVEPFNLVFRDLPPYHVETQWMICARDVETGNLRFFPVKNIHSWRPA